MVYKSKKLKGRKKSTRKNYNSKRRNYKSKRGGSNSRKSNNQILKAAESVASSALEAVLAKASANTLFRGKSKAKGKGKSKVFSKKEEERPLSAYEPETSLLAEALVEPTSIPKDSKTFLPLDGFKEKLIKLLKPKEAKHPWSQGSYLYCYIYFIKIKTGIETFDYYIYNSKTNKFWEGEKKKREQIKLENEFKWKDGATKRCKGIDTRWIDKEYDSNDISIMLFSIKKSSKDLNKRPHPYSLCGLIVLKNKESLESIDGMYLTLICSLQKIGGYLLELTKQISKLFNKTHIFLSSLEDPMPVYIHKGYEFIKGTNEYFYKDLQKKLRNNTKNSKQKVFRSNPKGIVKQHTKYYEDQWGDLYNIKDIVTSHRTKYREKEGNVLSGIKGDDTNGWQMFLKL